MQAIGTQGDPGKILCGADMGWVDAALANNARGAGPATVAGGDRLTGAACGLFAVTLRRGFVSGWGFTLLELLVTMALVALLAALVLPALNRAKERGQAVICLNNLRQWGLATQLYVVDHDDYLPPDGTPNPGNSATNFGWYIQLPQQLGLPRYHDQPWRTNANAATGFSVWICPANPRRSNGRNLFHYCLNGHVDGTGENDRPVRLGSLPDVSSLVWLFDSKNLPAVGYWGYTHTNLHQGGAQFLFLDGHARRYRRAEYWDELSHRGRTNNPALRWIP